MSISWVRVLALCSTVLLATACDGYVVRPRSHFATRSTRAERADRCAADPRACREACEDGDAGACNLLGVQLELGVGGARSASAASVVYRLGCDADYPPSCTNLGWLVLRGDGVPADPPVALVLFQRAYDGYARSCASGFGAGCVAAADALDLLAPSDDDEARALALLERGCALGEARACARLPRPD